MNRKTGRIQFNKFKQLINCLVILLSVLGRKGNFFFLNFFRNTNGIIGLLLRYIFLRNCAKVVGNNVSIHPGVYFFNPQNIEIGSNVSIHPMCYIEGAGGIIIGNDVSIAHSSTLISTSHSWIDSCIPIKYNPETFASIVIANDVWIGCGARILSGVTINNRTIVAAGAVVNKEVLSNTIIGGVPAKTIKSI